MKMLAEDYVSGIDNERVANCGRFGRRGEDSLIVGSEGAHTANRHLNGAWQNEMLKKDLRRG